MHIDSGRLMDVEELRKAFPDPAEAHAAGWRAVPPALERDFGDAWLAAERALTPPRMPTDSTT